MTPDSSQVWFTLKDTGKTQVFSAQPPFNPLRPLNTGPISNRVNIVRNANGMFAYVTVGGLNEVKVFRTDNFEQVATIPTGKLPHGIWPSGDGTRVYVGLENEDRIAAIDPLKNKVIATIRGGQAAQAVVYMPNAVPDGPGTQGLEPLGIAGKSEQLQLAPPGIKVEKQHPPAFPCPTKAWCKYWRPRSPGLDPGKPYLLALSDEPSGTGTLEPLKGFMTNPAGPSSMRSDQSVRWYAVKTRFGIAISSSRPAPPPRMAPSFRSRWNKERRLCLFIAEFVAEVGDFECSGLSGLFFKRSSFSSWLDQSGAIFRLDASGG